MNNERPLPTEQQIERLTKILRGRFIKNCKCHAWHAGECSCDNVQWPDDYTVEAADVIEQLYAALKEQKGKP